MSAGLAKDPFRRVVWLDGPEGMGARWWNERMVAGIRMPMDSERRETLAKLLLGASVVGLAVMFRCLPERRDDGVDETLDALDLQRRTSWDFGATDRSLSVSDGWTMDVDGSERWRAALNSGRLADLLAPPEGRLRPFYAPTLFQAPDHAAGRSLVPHLFPIHNAEMDDAYDRGRALAEMFEAAGRPGDTAVLIDLPGPQAVALAAGLADIFSPVFTFDNWPHPRGVVPSHRTLDAALYYLPRFESAAAKRTFSAPPAFVLDANRLNPYRDAASDFDNRYVVALPSFTSLQELGVRHIMYVTATDPVRESDDLNTDLVAFDGAGLAVRAVGLADFERDPEDAVVGRVAGPVADAGVAQPIAHHRYHYHAGGGGTFWRQYGWYETSMPRGKSAAAAPIVELPSRAPGYRPVARATIFSGRAFGAMSRVQKPSGFGKIAVHTSGGTISSGHGRSGSFGRGFSTFG